MPQQPLIIDYYTDILCIWAWIAQRRIEELNDTLGDQIELHHHYINLFGDTDTRIREQWADRGVYEGFAQHVIHAAEPFPEAPVHPDLWTTVQPSTSANAHLYIKAVQLAYNRQTATDFALTLRKAFFVEAKDISKLSILNNLLELLSLDADLVSSHLENGKAMAALMGDYQKCQQQSLRGSPSYVMDNGRQTLYGNVGYRVLYANIHELLRNPHDEASWC